jgi:tRNA nucleotidyltransferase (CCA-adding enzyme)
VLRHVSAAFEEDPVRILRVARFVARFGFRIAPETEALMRRMVELGEADHLVAERVWQEFSRGLMEKHPARMLEVLERCGLTARVMPELVEKDRGALERAAAAGASSPVRFAVLAWGIEAPAIEALAARLRAPNEERDLAVTAARCRPLLAARAPAALLELLKRGDAIRRRERFAQLLEAARLAQPDLDLSRVQKALDAAAQVDAGAIAQQFPQDIAARVDAARLAAIAKAV